MESYEQYYETAKLYVQLYASKTTKKPKSIKPKPSKEKKAKGSKSRFIKPTPTAELTLTKRLFSNEDQVMDGEEHQNIESELYKCSKKLSRQKPDFTDGADGNPLKALSNNISQPPSTYDPNNNKLKKDKTFPQE